MLGQVTGAGVAQGDGGVLRTAGEQQPQGTAHGDAASDHDDLRALERHVVAAEQLHDAARGARQRGLLHEDEPAQVDRLEAVRVLDRVDQVQHAPLVQPLGQGELHDVTRARRVLVELVDGPLHVRLGGVRGQVATDAGDAHLGAVPVLAAHVGVAAGVVPHQHGPQPGGDPLGVQSRHPPGQILLDGLGDGLSVQNDRAHALLLLG